MPNTKRARLSLDLDVKTKDGLERVRSETGKGSLTDLVKDSVALYGQVSKMQRDGGAVYFVRKDGEKLLLANISV